MDISLLTTTNDIEQLRAMALSMVQNAVSENADKEKLRQHNTDLQQRIRLLEEALILARQHRFGCKTETMAGLQRQLFEEDLDADIAATEAQIRTLLQQNETEDKVPPSHPVRKPLPAHLPHVTKTIKPASTESCPYCQGTLRFIRDEISEKLEYIRKRQATAACDSGSGIVSLELRLI